MSDICNICQRERLTKIIESIEAELEAYREVVTSINKAKEAAESALISSRTPVDTVDGWEIALIIAHLAEALANLPERG